MNYATLQSILYYNIACFLSSIPPLVALGHRVRRGHRLLSLGYMTLLVYAGGLVLRAFHTPMPPRAAIFIEFTAGALIALNEDWNPPGNGTFWSAIMAMAGFLACSFHIVFFSGLGAPAMALGAVIFILQALSVVLMSAHTYEILDVICRTRWRNVVRVRRPGRDYLPKVSLHVPAYNEPPEMVKETLSSLARLDYPHFEVIMVDDNTKDESLWRPVEEHCKALGFKFFHLEDWPGYKSGALNFALRHTAHDAEIIGVVDSDYVVKPGYLRDLVGLFRDPGVAFVQTPQDYRDFKKDDVYAKACYDAYRYFFRVSMAGRNEHNGIIFAGTMGLVRKDVLKDVGGWDEWCVTEDAELSLRILDKGYRGLYVDRTYGRGLMPLDYDWLKKQRFRWAFGGMQLLRLHWKKLVPGWGGGAGLTWTQKFAYLNGGIQWLNDPLTFAFTFLLFAGVGVMTLGGSSAIVRLSAAIVIPTFAFLLFSLLRFLWALRIRLSCSWREAGRALIILLGLTWVVTLACVQGLTRRQGVFLRTPKKKEDAGLASNFGIIRWELAFSVICAIGVGLLFVDQLPKLLRFVLVGLMSWQFFIYSSSMFSWLWSHKSAKLMDPQSGAPVSSVLEAFLDEEID